MHARTITITGFKGQTGSIELDRLTAITGPCGSGKTAYAYAPLYALTGRMPGQKVSDSPENCADTEMQVNVAFDNGREARRRIVLGKSVQERVSLDGGETWLTRSGADGALSMFTDGKTVVYDMHDFWAASPAEQMRIICGALGGDGVSDVIKSEEHERKELSRLRRVKLDAEAALKGLITDEAMAVKGNTHEIEQGRLMAQSSLDQTRKRLLNAVSVKQDREEIEDFIRETAEIEERTAKRLVALDVELRKAREALAAAANAEEFSVVEKPVQKDLGIVFSVLSKVKELIDESDACLAFEVSEAAHIAWKYTTEGQQTCLQNTSEYVKKKNAVANLEGEKEESQRILSEARQNAEKFGSKLSSLPEANTAFVAAAQAECDALEARIADLDSQLKSLHKRDALIEKRERLSIEVTRLADKCEQQKGKLDSVCSKRAAMVAGMSSKLRDSSLDVLPAGSLEIDVDDSGKGIRIQWLRDDRYVSRTTLSGGEKVVFDAAVQHALFPDSLLVLEAAECDSEFLGIAMLKMALCKDIYAVVCSCHAVEAIEGWTGIEMGVDHE